MVKLTCMQRMQSRQSLTLGGESEATVCFPVSQGAGLEIVVAQFWKSEGSSEVSAAVAFHGISYGTLSSDADSAHLLSSSMVLSPLLAVLCLFELVYAHGSRLSFYQIFKVVMVFLVVYAHAHLFLLITRCYFMNLL
jgi:hypothetical protein